MTSREDAERAMRDGVADLLEEVCKADRMHPQAIRIGQENLRASMDRLLRQCGEMVDWEGLCASLTADEIRRVTRDVLRPDVLKMLAPVRPS